MATNYNSIDEFKKAFRGGTRSNRFSVTATWPQNLGASNSFEMTRKTTFKITSTSMPDATVTTIPVNYRGRKIQFAGEVQERAQAATISRRALRTPKNDRDKKKNFGRSSHEQFA